MKFMRMEELLRRYKATEKNLKNQVERLNETMRNSELNVMIL